MSGDDARDAARWRALIGCGRMHYMGSAHFALTAFDPARGGDLKLENLRPVPEKDAPYLHFGMEFWSTYRDDVPPEASRFEREMVTAFVDHIVAEGRNG